MEEKQTYVVNVEGWTLGEYRKPGDEVEVTPKAAQYEKLAGKISPKIIAAGKAKSKTPPAEPVGPLSDS